MIDRKKLLSDLQSVTPGLAKDATIEQSDCFVFAKGNVNTFDGVVSCQRAIRDLDISGAVPAVPLMSVLSKLPSEKIQLEATDSELIIKSGSKSAGIRLSKCEGSPMKPETPKKWASLPENFHDALAIVRTCVSENDSLPLACCVHFTPKHLEACDNFQLARYEIKTGIEALVPRNLVKKMPAFGDVKIAVTKSWIHFRYKFGLFISCLKVEGKFANLDKPLDVSGKEITLPSGLNAVADRAKVFSDETEDATVLIQLRKGGWQMTGEGPHGWYKEHGKLKYDGPNMKFRIAPSLLRSLLHHGNHCEITGERLKVVGKNFIYVTSLGKT